MAGSIKWFVYTTDNGGTFAIELDESNTEAINGATGDYIDSTDIIFAVPRNLRPRFAIYSNPEKTRNIRCVALSQAVYAGLKAVTPTITDPFDDSILSLVRIRPEIIRLPYATDTGLIDEDSN